MATVYEMTDRDYFSIASLFYRADCPLEWLEFEIEELGDDGELHHYRHPVNGDDIVTFLC
jgi:hypothetical protein